MADARDSSDTPKVVKAISPPHAASVTQSNFTGVAVVASPHTLTRVDPEASRKATDAFLHIVRS